MTAMHVLVILFATYSPLLASDGPPLQWVIPPGFNPHVPGLGLPHLVGTRHDIVYAPSLDLAILTADSSEGMQGWYNHAPELVPFRDAILAIWTNHAQDENGPGQRQLARVGRVDRGTGRVVWAAEVVEIAPPPVLMTPRDETHDPHQIDGPYARCRLEIIGGKLYVFGELSAYDGWSNDPRYNHIQGAPIPAEHYRDGRDRGAGFRYDIKRDLGYRFIQQWDVVDGQLIAASPIYVLQPMIDEIEVTPGRFKRVVPISSVYAHGLPIEQAPLEIQRAAPAPPDVALRSRPVYAPGTEKLTAEGTHGLAHQAEFRRPDGRWTVVRDNLLNPGCYYAATKDAKSDPYPPAVRTNLFGDVQPDAGLLPDGRIWLIGNDRSRQHLYLTISDDGVNFDQTRLLYQAAVTPRAGIGKSTQPNGPQYERAVILDDHLLVIYSVAKERIGITTVPLAALAP